MLPHTVRLYPNAETLSMAAQSDSAEVRFHITDANTFTFLQATYGDMNLRPDTPYPLTFYHDDQYRIAYVEMEAETPFTPALQNLGIPDLPPNSIVFKTADTDTLGVGKLGLIPTIDVTVPDPVPLWNILLRSLRASQIVNFNAASRDILAGDPIHHQETPRQDPQVDIVGDMRLMIASQVLITNGESLQALDREEGEVVTLTEPFHLDLNLAADSPLNRYVPLARGRLLEQAYRYYDRPDTMPDHFRSLERGIVLDPVTLFLLPLDHWLSAQVLSPMHSSLLLGDSVNFKVVADHEYGGRNVHILTPTGETTVIHDMFLSNLQGSPLLLHGEAATYMEDLGAPIINLFDTATGLQPKEAINE